MKIESSLENCKKLWEKFSPKKTLWDEWEINECFYTPETQQLAFLYTDNSLLPLVYDSQLERHQFFGNTFIENRTFWIDDAEVVAFFDNLPEKIYLHDMNGDAVEALLQKHPTIEGFYLDKYRNFWSKSNAEFLGSFTAKHRGNFLRELRKLDYVNCTTEGSEFAPQALELFTHFNRLRFGEESDFYDVDYLTSWKKVVSLPYIGFIVARVDSKVVGIEVFANFKKVIYMLQAGYDTSISGLGKLLTWQGFLIKEAENLSEIDFMGGVGDWKSNFHLEQDKYYSFKR